jgi:hypothetical protein
MIDGILRWFEERKVWATNFGTNTGLNCGFGGSSSSSEDDSYSLD